MATVVPLPVVAPALRLTDAERSAGERRWNGSPLPRVVIHPGGVSARHWHPTQYRELAQRLAQGGYAVGLTGSQVEREQFQSGALAGVVLHSGVMNFMGQLAVRELMAVIAAAHVVVSGATGPAHLDMRGDLMASSIGSGQIKTVGVLDVAVLKDLGLPVSLDLFGGLA